MHERVLKNFNKMWSSGQFNELLNLMGVKTPSKLACCSYYSTNQQANLASLLGSLRCVLIPFSFWLLCLFCELSFDNGTLNLLMALAMERTGFLSLVDIEHKRPGFYYPLPHWQSSFPSPHRCLNSLHSNRPSRATFLFPTDADYAQAISRWAIKCTGQCQDNDSHSSRTSEDVALAIAYAKVNNHLPIAIRGRSHSTSGTSSTEGLVIDISRHLNSVEVDPENRLAFIGGGAMWEQVDKLTIQYGLAIAGTVNHVCCCIPACPLILMLCFVLSMSQGVRFVDVFFVAIFLLVLN